MFKKIVIQAHAESGGSSSSRVTGTRGPIPSNVQTQADFYNSGRGTALGGNSRTRGVRTSITRV